jgi:hypothetical protein
MMSLREMAIEEGYAPPEILEQIDFLTTAANDLRKDCINLILHEGEITKEQIRENFEKMLEQL